MDKKCLFIYLFIYGVFNNDVSSSGYMALLLGW
jgi:hypothetical protein